MRRDDAGACTSRRYNRRGFQRLRLLLNPRLTALKPYPFERLRALVSSVAANPAKRPINLSIGEPRHPTPSLVLDALSAGAKTGLAHYPTTNGPLELREAVARWLRARLMRGSRDAGAWRGSEHRPSPRRRRPSPQIGRASGSAALAPAEKGVGTRKSVG